MIYAKNTAGCCLRTHNYTSGSGTTSYTGLAEVEPGVVLLAYDKIGAGRVGAIQKVYSMRIFMGATNE